MRAASRTFCTAGNKSPIRTAMMAITTSNSMRVNAERRGRRDMEESPQYDGGNHLVHPCFPGENDKGVRNPTRIFLIVPEFGWCPRWLAIKNADSPKGCGGRPAFPSTG